VVAAEVEVPAVAVVAVMAAADARFQ